MTEEGACEITCPSPPCIQVLHYHPRATAYEGYGVLQICILLRIFLFVWIRTKCLKCKGAYLRAISSVDPRLALVVP